MANVLIRAGMSESFSNFLVDLQIEKMQGKEMIILFFLQRLQKNALIEVLKERIITPANLRLWSTNV